MLMQQGTTITFKRIVSSLHSFPHRCSRAFDQRVHDAVKYSDARH
jgi:hypothetical protein